MCTLCVCAEQVSVVAVLAVPEALLGGMDPIWGVDIKTSVSSVANGLIIPLLNYVYRQCVAVLVVVVAVVMTRHV